MHAAGSQSASTEGPGAAPVGWGILGAARIATKRVIPALAGSENLKVVAVGSRDRAKAASVAKQAGIERAYGSYEEVLQDAAVEAVYIPLPNHLHLPWIERAAAAGKHVLCEKPLTLDAAEARRAREVCREAGVLLMEAFMWRWQPRYRELLRVLREGVIGEVRLVRAAFSFVLEDLANNVRGRPEWGGGALFDVGCYCINASRLIFGAEPVEAQCSWHLHPELGVDLTTTGILRFPGDRMAVFDASFEMPGGQRLEIVGTRGTIRVPRPFQPEGVRGFFIGGPSGDMAGDAALKAGSDAASRAIGGLPGSASSAAGSGGHAQSPARPGAEDHYRLQFEAFSRWVRERRTVVAAPGEDGVANMGALEACTLSAKEGRPVAVAAG